jgi:hypothetical protein
MLAFACGLSLAAPTAAQTLVITGGTVIDGTGAAPLPAGVVVMENGRITAIGRAGEVAVPANATRIDATGKYVIPGLMDANLHLFLNIDLETLIKHEDRYHEIVLEAAQIALKTGQTTVFDTWGPRAALVKARDMIARGEAPGSRIYLAGNIIGFDGPLSADFRAQAAPYVSKAFVKRTNETWEEGTGRALLWLTPEEVRQVIRDYAQKAVDFLKYGASGHVDMNFVTFSPRVQKASWRKATAPASRCRRTPRPWRASTSRSTPESISSRTATSRARRARFRWKQSRSWSSVTLQYPCCRSPTGGSRRSRNTCPRAYLPSTSESPGSITRT